MRIDLRFPSWMSVRETLEGQNVALIALPTVTGRGRQMHSKQWIQSTPPVSEISNCLPVFPPTTLTPTNSATSARNRPFAWIPLTFTPRSLRKRMQQSMLAIWGERLESGRVWRADKRWPVRQ